MNEIKCPSCGKVIPIDEKDFSAILSQVRTSEFDREIEKREEEIKKNLEEKHSHDLESQLNSERSSKDREINELKIQIEKLKADKNAEISSLEQQLKSSEENQQLMIEAEIAKAVKPKDDKISELRLELNKNNANQELAVRDAVDKIKSERDIQKAEYEAEIKKQKELVEYYKDLKKSLSTKMVGESLERHCELEFRKIQGYFPPGCVTFGKDNTVAENSKGDFIYREQDEYGNELLSIMFEMKNEEDTTKTKHKNKDFLNKLDKDRKNKNCEYAVLVSMLESDNEYYNQGITIPQDEKFEKMYIVRPQCFLPIISILRNAAMSISEYKKRAADLEQKNIDIMNFESKLTGCKEDFLKSYNHAKNNFDKAIEEIDATIDKLESIKEYLQTAGNKLGTANRKLKGISVKKLAKDSPSLLAIELSSDN